MLRCDYVARNKIVAVRLNGKNFPRSRPVRDESGALTMEVGEFLIHGGVQPGYFLPGTNVLEIDVNNVLLSGTSRMLWLRPEISGIRVVPARGSTP